MLEVKNIDVFYGEIKALWDVSLHIETGELVSIIGANGAGKSTLVDAIAGLITPQSGEVVFNGQRMDTLAAHQVVQKGISLILEERGIFPGMTVLENLEMGAYLPKGREVLEETFQTVFELFQVLDERKNQVAGTMSGGEQQMLAIGRALMSKPKLLIFDEPSLSLAPLIVKNIFKAIKRINADGVSVLLVEQNVRAALELANRAYIIENGRITGHGESEALRNDDRIRQAYLGTL
jgi:branched-chain amino acid transport system ATP-binding protein